MIIFVRFNFEINKNAAVAVTGGLHTPPEAGAPQSRHPLEQAPPRAGTPQNRHPPEQAPPAAGTPSQIPLKFTLGCGPGDLPPPRPDPTKLPL